MMYKLYFRITKVPDGKNESGFIQEHENTKMEAAEEKADPIKEEKEGQAKWGHTCAYGGCDRYKLAQKKA